jgi:hypothetical protein
VPWLAREDYTMNTTTRTVLYFDSDTTATAGSSDVTRETETGCDSDVERHVERSQWTAITRLQPSAPIVYRFRGGPTLDIKQGTPYKKNLSPLSDFMLLCLEIIQLLVKKDT